MPISCSEKMMITKPAAILRNSEFCKKIWPIIEAVAPNKMNTVEKPIQNKINGKIFIFLLDKTSLNDLPDTNDT